MSKFLSLGQFRDLPHYFNDWGSYEFINDEHWEKEEKDTLSDNYDTSFP